LHGKTHQDIGAVVARLELFLQTGLRDLAWRCGRQILPMHQMGETTSSSELLCCFQWCRTMPGTADLAGQSRPAMFWPGHRRRPHRQRLEMMRFRGSADARSAQGSPTRSRATAGRGNPPSSQACNPSCQRGLSDVRPSLLTSEQIRRRRARTKGTAIRPGDGNSARLSARGIKQGLTYWLNSTRATVKAPAKAILRQNTGHELNQIWALRHHSLPSLCTRAATAKWHSPEGPINCRLTS
jgi:hypothetical protein